MSKEVSKTNVLILAAGKGSRIKLETEQHGSGFPKGLLEVGGIAIIERLLSQVKSLQETHPNLLSKVALVANADSYPHYSEYVNQEHPQIQTVSNGIHENEKLQGAIGDLVFMLDYLEWWNDNLLILPSDTLADVSLLELMKMFEKQGKNINVVHEYPNTDRIKNQLGCVELDETGTIIGFEEKPSEPKSSITSVPIYLYTAATLKLIGEYARKAHTEGKPELLDSPGAILPWLIEQVPVQAFFATSYDDVGRAEVLARLRQAN